MAGRIYPNLKSFPLITTFFWARPIGSCQNGHGSLASEQFFRSQN